MPRYTYVWQFRVRHGSEAEFRRHYGPDGTWVRLFRQAPGYLDTVLLEDLDRPATFLTVDRWRDEAAYRAFRQEFAREFADLDEQCAKLTENEVDLGRYSES
jgi:quinol monooxygenase YgiN